MKNKSYKKAECCYGSDCDLLDYEEDEPCWGRVNVWDEEWTDDDYWWLHRCEGHFKEYYEPYIKEL